MTDVFAKSTADAIYEILRGADDLVVLLGPVLRRSFDGREYFHVAVSRGGFFLMGCLGGERSREKYKQEMLTRPPIVVQEFDGILELAQVASAIWSSAEAEKWRNDIIAVRNSAA